MTEPLYDIRTRLMSKVYDLRQDANSQMFVTKGLMPNIGPEVRNGMRITYDMAISCESRAPAYNRIIRGQCLSYLVV